MSNRAANHIDVHVGSRVYMRRRDLDMRQPTLADAIGVKFGTLQNYEKGRVCISASKLFAISQKLEVPISYFFDGLPTPERPNEDDTPELTAFLRCAEGVRIPAKFPHLAAPVRTTLLSMIEAMGKADG